MVDKPPMKNKRPHAVCLLCGLGVALALMMSFQVKSFLWFFQLIAFVFAIAGIQVFIRYLASDFVYELSENNFNIYRVQGKKRVCLCSLDLTQSMSKVMPQKEYLRDKNTYGRPEMALNYCKNMSADSVYYYFFSFRDRRTMLVFEPSEEFADAMNARIPPRPEEGEGKLTVEDGNEEQ